MKDGLKAAIQRAFDESVSAKTRFLRDGAAELERVIGLVAARLVAGSKLLLFGNGGSAADAQHLAAEFVNRFAMERPPLPAIALTTDTSVLTSIGNDYGYAEVFAKQVKALGREGDVAFAITTSGNSPSVLRAVDVCRRRKIHTVGLTGGDAGKLAGKVDHLLSVSATKTVARIQETHILIGHVICEMVDVQIFGGEGKRGA
jgi:D-sedoheptulose 7-phosphate isomerase